MALPAESHPGESSHLLQVVGAGAAGMSLVLALCNRIAVANTDAAAAQQLLDSLLMFESDRTPGGKMGRYRVNANTSAHDAVQGIDDGTPFVAVRDHYLTHPQTQVDLIPLPLIDKLMVAPLAQTMVDFLGQRLRCDTEVRRIAIDSAGFNSFDANDRWLACSNSLLLCCGAREIPLAELKPFHECWEGSGKFLMRSSLEGLPESKQPIIIIGASHSAFSCAWRLLHDPLFEDFSTQREIIILQRREQIKLRCTPEFAAAHQIDYNAQTDICPRTGLVFRSGGLRKDAKRLYLDIRDGKETRVKLVEMASLQEQRGLLEQATLILQATGFSSNLPRIEQAGRELRVGKPGKTGELSDLDTGEVVPGLYGMGLGINILPDGDARGEPSFHGGIHGFQSYPLALAPLILERILVNLPAEVRK